MEYEYSRLFSINDVFISVSGYSIREDAKYRSVLKAITTSRVFSYLRWSDGHLRRRMVSLV